MRKNPHASRLSFSRGKENQNFQIFTNGMKTMLNIGGDKDNGAGFNGPVFLANTNKALSFYNIVDFILIMRLLGVSSTCRQSIQANTQRRNTEEFQIGFTGTLLLDNQLRNFKSIHRSLPPGSLLLLLLVFWQRGTVYHYQPVCANWRPKVKFKL